METASRHVGSVVRRLLTVGAAAFVFMTVLVAGTLATGGSALATPAVSASDEDAPALYLVTLEGPGTSGSPSPLPPALIRWGMETEQNAALALVDAGPPVYRWTTALNGFAVPLTSVQAADLAAVPGVTLIEKNSVRPLAATTSSATGLTDASGPRSSGRRGGAGVVIGIVDSGIYPDSPLFADVPGLGRASSRFVGECTTGQEWEASTCNRKLVGSAWFVDGFGADNVRASSSLSARDDDGHGTQMASIAAGNDGVSVRVRGQRLGNYSGVAPKSRLAVYKACWTAPDPHHDGCATADLVSAIDQATQDGVDVLNLSVGGPAGYDTVERALLGAAEANIVVVAAAGNSGSRSYASHPGPWVTTVGGTTGVLRRGRVVLGDGTSLSGAMASTRAVGPARLVVGSLAAAPGSTRGEARVCTPGSLDAAKVSGTIVLCERGDVGRVDKSAAVKLADGAGMVLANTGRGTIDADFHSVPTVHVDFVEGMAVRRWAVAHPEGRVTLNPLGVDPAPATVVARSSGGDPTAAAIKPDLVAPATGVLGAVPRADNGAGWDFVSGTSAATAYTSGAAAVLLGRHTWSASSVRSALVTSASRVSGNPSVLRAGSGRVRPERALRPGIVYPVQVGDYRAWLDGTLSDQLNIPSVVLSGDETTATRTITNVGRRRLYFSSSATGFMRHSITVTPAAVRLAPGERATYTVSLVGSKAAQPLDDGWITWLGANGTSARIPVLLSR